MRLKQLKISGFKSFADTTVIEFPHAVTGIVGPNGCGKSNVMDAIRWVLGEGRVSELRGQSSMTELIFSGSQARSPSARAAVEMVLDNSDGQAGGNWGRYSEISVKRIITRDGSSTYMVNGQAVRRRDVQDIFMGTGLGPRSYAIISQGMISNFIRAKPEELRVYLEEAAGVSKYKERRRETENSLAATKENLEKVALVQETKKADIERLQGEAEVAQKWDELDAQRTRAELIWYFLQEKQALDAVNQIAAEIAEQEALLEKEKTSIGTQTQELEEHRARVEAAKQAAEAARKEAWAAGEALARAKTDAEKLIQQRDFCRKRIADAQNLITSRQQDQENAQREAQDLLTQAQNLLAQAQAAEEESAGLEDTFAQADDDCNQAASAYDQARSNASAMENRIGVANAEMEALGREVANCDDQIAQCQGLLREVHLPDPAQLEAVSSQLEEKQAAAEDAAAQAEELNQSSDQKRQEAAQAAEDFKVASETEARLEERISALQSVQDKAQAEGRLPQWLTDCGLEGLPRFFEKLEVDNAWARAIEAALSVRAAALPLGRLQTAAGFLAAPPPARLSFYDSSFLSPAGSSSPAAHWEPLSTHAHSADANAQAVLGALLAQCWCAPSLAAALESRAELSPGQRLFTPEGHCVETSAVTFWAEDNPRAGLLSRAAEISRLTQEQETLLTQLEQKEEKAKSLERTVESLTVRAKAQFSLAQELDREAHTLELELSKAQAALESGQLRKAELTKQLESARAKKEEAEARRDEADARFQSLDEELSVAAQAAEEANAKLKAAQARVKDIESRSRQLQDDARMKDVQARAAQQRALDRKTGAEKAAAEIEKAKAQLTELEEELAGIQHETQSQGLEEAAALYDQTRARETKCEQEQGAAEEALEKLREALQELTARQAPLLQKISELKVKRENWLGQTQALSGRLEEVQVDRKELAQQAAQEKCTITGMKNRVARLAREIEELGPVNHAALAHLQSVQEALAQTAKQVEDLQAAIANLEDTIRRIDAETRGMLRSTFDAVNDHFGRMFTGLFGGGQAQLTMTGEEVLESGIEVRAQPPGKRNASTRVLSGGEQAMAAIALVFAIFQLNPAPFCLLDEVDAPLDEANQERLARQVVAMSEGTQFVLITHHRVTMEFVKDLIGVTMKEPGVSRVVSVSVDDAVKMSSQQIG